MKQAQKIPTSIYSTCGSGGSSVQADGRHHRGAGHLVAVVQGGDEATQRLAEDPVALARPLVDEEGHDAHVDQVGQRQVADVHVRHGLLHRPADRTKRSRDISPLTSAHLRM